jgi:hypothetical protein
VLVAAPAIGFQLVAEVADIAAGRVEREVRRCGDAARGQLGVEVVEDGAGHLTHSPGRFDGDLAVADPVGDQFAPGAGVGTEVGEAGQTNAVQPERVRNRSEQRGERGFGVDGDVERAHGQTGAARCRAGDGDRGSGRLAVGRGAVAEAGEEFGAELGGHRLGMELQSP